MEPLASQGCKLFGCMTIVVLERFSAPSSATADFTGGDSGKGPVPPIDTCAHPRLRHRAARPFRPHDRRSSFVHRACSGACTPVALRLSASAGTRARYPRALARAVATGMPTRRRKQSAGRGSSQHCSPADSRRGNRAENLQECMYGRARPRRARGGTC